MFLFEAANKRGICRVFIMWVELLHENVSASMNLNESPSLHFLVREKRG